MENNKLNRLLKKANKISTEHKTNTHLEPPLVQKKELKHSDFKLYYTLIDAGYHGYNFWFIFDAIGISIFIIAAGLALIGKNDNDWFLYFKIISIVGAIYFIIKLIILRPLIHTLKYPSFKNWIKNNSFNIIGWDKIYNNDDLLLRTSWYKQCTITINLVENCPQTTKDFIIAAAIIFIKNVNTIQTYYYDGLEKWELKDMKLIGSTNSSTLGFVHRLIKNDLNLINKIHGGILSLEIGGDKQTIYVDSLPYEG
jgi:hypothetical protein